MSDVRPAVLFDIDGTLVDSNYLHTLAWSRALADGGEWAPMNAIHRLIGMGSDTLLPALIGRTDDEIADFWKVHYEAMMSEVRPFPGASALVREVAATGAAAVLATSSPGAHLSFLVALLGLGDEVAAATTADDAEKSKPDPEIFLTAMARVGGDPARTFVIGDSRWDVEAANSARMRCIAVETGGFSEAELTAAGAIAVYEDVDALRRDLATGPLAQLLART